MHERVSAEPLIFCLDESRGVQCIYKDKALRLEDTIQLNTTAPGTTGGGTGSDTFTL